MGMKVLLTTYDALIAAGRWDIDYHLPPIEIKKFSKSILVSIKECAEIVTEKRNPTQKPEQSFWYIDIAAVDVVTGIIVNAQEMLGEEAPSRARKVVREGDIIISTCRPTRGAIAIIPHELDNQICSTGFCVIRAKENANNQYLHFILRGMSTKEQFKKFSTGSSYPAILDSDVMKTLIPLPSLKRQDKIASEVYQRTSYRNAEIERVNKEWQTKLNLLLDELKQEHL